MSPTRREAAAGLLAAAGAALGGGNGALCQPTPETPSEEPSTQVDTIRSRFEHVLAPVIINGRGPYRFVLDTGANVSCVSRQLAERLALAPGPPSRVHTMVGVRERPSVIIDHLQVGARQRKAVRASALPINYDVDGVLGVDWLKGQRLVIGFRSGTLEFTRPKADVSTGSRVVVPARRKFGQLTIVDADLGNQRISAMIDSGSQVTLCNTALREAVMRAQRRRGRVEPPVLVRLETVAGEKFTGEQLFVPFVRLGGLQLGNVPVVHADTHVFRLWGLEEQPALMLGIDLLTEFTSVTLDFGHSQVRFDIA